MPDERWRRVQELFEQLEGIEPSERHSFLAANEPDDGVRREALALLEAARLEAAETSRLRLAAGLAESLPGPLANLTLLAPLGSGGFSTVYSAIRHVNGTEQPVAVKLFHAHHAGPEARRRFEREQRVLASLNHPGIVRFLDAGSTPAGQPYLVMEKVDGCHITEHADRNRLGIEGRIGLIAGACRALEEAHRHLLVHLDLKPSNVLVAASGEVKLLDFGTAKLLDDTTGAATHTQQLTPLYASPERLRGEPGSVGSDIYSLGLVLYELLCGGWPYQDRASMAAILARAEGNQTLQPLARACTAEAAAARRTTLERLRRELEGDLQAICAKALAHDPRERYGSVGEFLDDLLRYLDGKPVLAHPPGVVYRTRKFLHRNAKSVVLGAAAAAVLLTAGGYAWRERMQGLQRIQEARAMASYLLFDLYDRINDLPGSTAVRAHMAAQAQSQLDRLSRLPGAGIDLRLEAAAGYNRLAEIQGISGSSSLGDSGAAAANLRRARSLIDSVLSADSGFRPALIEDARNLLLSAKLHNWNRRNTAAALPMIERARRQLERTRDPADPNWLRAHASLAVQQADLAEFDRDYAAEQRIADAALARLAAWPAELRAGADYTLRRAALLKRRGNSSYYLERHGEALSSYQQAHDLLAALDARHPNRPEVLYALMDMSYQIAYCHGEMQQPQAMLEAVRASLRIGEELLRHDRENRALARSYWNKRQALAESLAALARFEEALREQEAVLQARRAAHGAEPDSNLAAEDVLVSEGAYAEIVTRSGDPARGCVLARSALQHSQAMHASGAMTAKTWDAQQRQLGRILENCAGQ